MWSFSVAWSVGLSRKRDSFIAGSKLQRFADQFHGDQRHSLHLAADDAAGDSGR